MARRVERRAPEQDWRGIAMLAEQLGGLFEPSKAKLQSREQEHEMRLLEAKQSWEFGKERLKSAKDQLIQARKDLETEQGNLEPYGADVMAASMLEGALPEEASTILEDNDIRKLSDLNDLANQYHEQLMATKKQLDQFEDMNTHAIFGKEFGDNYMGKKGAKNYRKEFDVEPETPGLLSTDERENIKHAVLMDNYHVPDEELEATEHITLTAAGQQINVRPEAVAFAAGYDQSGEFKPEARALKTIAAKAGYAKLGAMDEYLNLDAAFMNLSPSDQILVATAYEQGTDAGLAARLKDTYLALEERDKLSVELQKAGMDVRVQPLPDTVFDPVDAPGLFTGDIQNWVQAGLGEEMYKNLRKMGSKAGDTRAGFEHTINNWDTLSDTAKEAAINKIKTEYAALIKKGI